MSPQGGCRILILLHISDTVLTVLLDRGRGGDNSKYDMKYVVPINWRDRRSDVKVRQAMEAAAAADDSSVSFPQMPRRPFG